MTKARFKLFIPLLIVFILINIFCISFQSFLLQHNTDYRVVLVTNLMLFLICSLGFYRQMISVANTNPHAMVRGVMSSVVLKLFVLGTAAFLYLYNAGENKSVNALFLGMALYIVYTWLEVKIAMQLKPPKDGGN